MWLSDEEVANQAPKSKENLIIELQQLRIKELEREILANNPDMARKLEIGE